MSPDIYSMELVMTKTVSLLRMWNFHLKERLPEDPTTASETTDSKEAIQEITGGALTPFSLPSSKTDYWKPVIDELNSFGEQINNDSHSWLYIFFAGFVGGLLALFTPCVWPIIPMTVSFFLKRTKDKKKVSATRVHTVLLLWLFILL